MSPAFSSTLMCLVTAGMVILKGSANSVTVLSPDASWARIARRAGCANAESVVSSRFAAIK